MNGVDIATLIVIATSQILGLFMFLWSFTYYRLRHTHEISARLPNASLLAGIICNIGVCFTHPAVLLFLNTSLIQYIPYSYTFFVFAVMVTTLAPFHIFTFRAFIIYFDMKWNKAMEDQQWRVYIDPQEKNWFLKHRSSWGNKKRIGIIACIHWLFWTILVVIVTLYNNDKSNIQSRAILALGALLPTIIDCTLYCKFPTYSDIWGIHKEIKLLLEVKIAGIVIYYMVAIVFKPAFPSYGYIALQSLAIVIGFTFTLIIYLWVFKRFGLPSNPLYVSRWLHINNLNYELSYSHTSTYSKSKNVNKETHSLALQQILCTKHGFNEFARHLTREFCLENLLFIVESEQWLQSLAAKKEYSQIVKHIEQKQGRLTLKLNFPDSAPKSSLLQNNSFDTCNYNDNVHVEDESKEDLPSSSEYSQCFELFSKYIRNGAYFSVNISSDCRDELYKVFGFNDSSTEPNIDEIVKHLKDNKMSREDLFNLFQVSRRQIYQLLIFTYSRFKQTDEFAQLNGKININMATATLEH